MGTTLVKDIFTKVINALQDEGSVRWTRQELVDWYNEALKDMLKPGHHPEWNPRTVVHPLAAGALQTLQPAYICILSIGNNMGTNGTTRGIIPLTTEKEVMDSAYPGWQGATGAVNTIAVIASKATLRQFYTYPPQPATPGNLEIVASAYPVKATVATVDHVSTPLAFELDDIHEPIAIEYVLYRCFYKDSDNPSYLQRSTSHFQTYLGMMGVGAQPAAQ